MVTTRRVQRYTYADYVGVEMTSPTTKHEFLDGQIYAMAGGTEDHSKLCAEMITALTLATRNGRCDTHTSDLRIYVEQVGLAAFPDVSVICGPFVQHPPSPKATALNPTVLVEVTSDSSEHFDTVDKLGFYQTIPTLRDYVIVSHRERRITVHARDEGGAWSSRTAISGGSVSVDSVGANLAVDEVYRRTSI
jgi:Uma2 family endonuclease